MKALSLWQPYAAFITAGLKRVETRSWSPPVDAIGTTILIHAARRQVNGADRELMHRVGFDGSLYYGCVVVRARIAWAEQVRPAGLVSDRMLAHKAMLDPDLGDWSAGRWLWALDEVTPVWPPVPCRGRQGLWTVPPEMLEAMWKAML